MGYKRLGLDTHPGFWRDLSGETEDLGGSNQKNWIDTRCDYSLPA